MTDSYSSELKGKQCKNPVSLGKLKLLALNVGKAPFFIYIPSVRGNGGGYTGHSSISETANQNLSHHGQLSLLPTPASVLKGCVGKNKQTQQEHFTLEYHTICVIPVTKSLVNDST